MSRLQSCILRFIILLRILREGIDSPRNRLLTMSRTTCHHCGKEIFGEIPFCPHCGKKQPPPLSEREKTQNPFTILQVSEDAEPEVIEAAYKSLSKKYHPDIDKSKDAEEKMKDINWAYDILSDSIKKTQWIRGGKQEAKSKPKTSQPPPKQKSVCPYCAEDILISDVICPHCDRAIATGAPKQKTQSHPPQREKEKNLVIRLFSSLLFIVLIIYGMSYFNSGSNFSPINTKRPTKRATRTPTQNAAKILIQMAATENASVPGFPTYPCIRWDKVNESHIGQEICVYGLVTNKNETDLHKTVINFGSSAFYILAYNYYLDIKRGLCIEVYGVVDSTYAYLFIMLWEGNAYPSIRCE